MQRFSDFHCQRTKDTVMKFSVYFLLSLFAVGMFFSGCQKSVNDSRVTTGPEISDLKGKILYQFSFEDNNYDTNFKGWTSPYYSFSKDVPPGGGVWSLQLMPGWIPWQGFAEHVVKLDTGKYQLKFRCYTKVLSNATNTGVGYIRLIKRSISATSTTKDKILAEKSFTNHAWETRSVLSSVQIGRGDVIVLQVSAGASELITWATLFDSVTLLSQ
jgi:hypothetical protein